MKRKDIKAELKHRIIAVIRVFDYDLAKSICKAIIEEGINVLEITFTVDRAADLISQLKRDYPDALIGAGTVLNKEQAKSALENHADFIVSPCIITEVADFCNDVDIFFSMGAATPTEALTAYNLGCDLVKLFPGETLSPSLIKAIKAPLPFIDMMPTGGVDDETIVSWFENGAYAVGVGGYLTKNIAVSNLDELKNRCRRLLHANTFK